MRHVMEIHVEIEVDCDDGSDSAFVESIGNAVAKHLLKRFPPTPWSGEFRWKFVGFKNFGEGFLKEYQ